MTLTKKKLDMYLKYRKVKIPEEYKNELLEQFGKPFLDDTGHVMEYSEQDISEQLRNAIQNYIEGGDKRD
jgi:hypothetical protein